MAKPQRLKILQSTFLAKKTTLTSVNFTDLVTATNSMVWPKDSRKGDYYINEKVMYELLLSSQHSKTENFRKHYCNVMFSHFRQQLTNKMFTSIIKPLQTKITGSRLSSMQMWHYKSNDMFIRSS